MEITKGRDETGQEVYFLDWHHPFITLTPIKFQALIAELVRTGLIKRNK